MNNATISTYVPKNHYPLLFERTRMKNSPGGHSKILGGKQQIQGEKPAWYIPLDHLLESKTSGANEL